LKLFLLILSSLLTSTLFSQKIDSIYFNLYTDSLKKGTFNYINIDGLLSNGKYLPLDSNHLIFISSAGKFYGNSLWLEKNIQEEKLHIKVVLRKNPAIFIERDVWIKTREAIEPLKTLEQLLEQQGRKPARKKGRKN